MLEEKPIFLGIKFQINDKRKIFDNRKSSQRIIKIALIIFIIIIISIYIGIKIIRNQVIGMKPKLIYNNTAEVKPAIIPKTLPATLSNILLITLSQNVTVKPIDLLTKSYAQVLEDIILLGFLYDVKNGFYIDIGANDPIRDSVTKLFYLRGWNGINIEPLINRYKELMTDRPRDINLNIGIGAKKEKRKFYIADGLSSLKKGIANAPETIIQMETMAYICKKYVPKNTVIEFCKIDVEGGEKEVLLGFDLEHYRPKIFCIESAEPLTLKDSYQLFEDILFRNNYTFVFQYSVNRFYIDNNTNYLAKRLNLVKGMIELYEDFKKHQISDFNIT